MIQVFSKQWFKKYNKQLCWLANSCLGQFVFKFKKFGHYPENKIIKITPNSVGEFLGYKEEKYSKNISDCCGSKAIYDGKHFKSGKPYYYCDKCGRWCNYKNTKKRIEIKEHFFGRNEYALRLQKVFYPIWITFHTWDMLIANKFKPSWNLGFDTLTVYPDADPESTSVDGFTRNITANLTWANLRINGNGAFSDTTRYDQAILGNCGTETNKYTSLARSIFLFDTSALTSGATISAVVMSLYGYGKAKTISGDDPDVNIYTSTPATNTDLVVGDYVQIGTTPQCDTAITYTNYDEAGYNDFTFNATGRGNVSKTSISKFGARNANYDVANFNPAWGSGLNYSFGVYFADYGSNKPKLVVTYTTGPTHTLTCETGSFTLTGIDTGLIGTYKIVCETGSFILTGIDAIIAKGYFIICETGSFALTGIDTGIKAGYKIVCETGAFTLTGIDVVLNKGYKIVCETGSFLITWIDIKIRSMRNRAKVSTSFTNRSKNSTTLTNKSKNSTSFTNRSK